MVMYEEVNSGKKMDLDETLSRFGLGSYQVTVCFLMGLVLMYSNISPLSYAITTAEMKYRCAVPQCEDVNEQYDMPWLRSAIPFDDKKEAYTKCDMYSYIEPQNSTVNNTCAPTSFNQSSKIMCNTFVYGEKERTIQNDFNIMCEEGGTKLNFVGTINSLGQFIGIPLSGFISDKYGRKFIMITGSVLSALLGTIRSFTNNYFTFILFEFLDSVASSGVYAATFVLGVELVSPSARATASTIMGSFYPMGAVICGFVAYLVLDWRLMLRIVYLPGLLILGYIWYVPESIRWLQTQKKFDEMTKIMLKVAKSNKTKLSADFKNELAASHNDSNNVDENKLSSKKLMKQIFNSKEIFLRLINCSFCWTTITLVYYGLSLSSITFNGDRHVNFMLINAIEIPAFLSSWYFTEKCPRRYTQACSFLLSGISCIAVNIVSNEHLWLKYLFFLGSKFAITVAFNTIYVFTAEMFPTHLRMSLFGIASMFGRLGSMIAPHMKTLGDILNYPNAPIMLFGILSFVAGAMAFLFPETKNQKLPDTVEEAEEVGGI